MGIQGTGERNRGTEVHSQGNKAALEVLPGVHTGQEEHIQLEVQEGGEQEQREMRHQENELGPGLDESDEAIHLVPWRHWDMHSSGAILREDERVGRHSVLEVQQVVQQGEHSELGVLELEVLEMGEEHNELGEVPEQVQEQWEWRRLEEPKMGRQVA